MNHLAHFVLAPDDDQARTGTWLGDFVRGSDLSAWPATIEQAIRLHRRIDSFTDTHAVTLDARRGLPAPLRRYAGILLDVYFDHLLIRDWPRWHGVALSRTTATVCMLAWRASRPNCPIRPGGSHTAWQHIAA